MGSEGIDHPCEIKSALTLGQFYHIRELINMSKSKVYNLSDEEFQQMIARNHSWCACAREVGLSPNGSNSKIQLKKRVEELGLDTSHFD
jgi:hypothetical protein